MTLPEHRSIASPEKKTCQDVFDFLPGEISLWHSVELPVSLNLTFELI